MSAPIRVRFAPSPTGYLHIGGVRAALFNWLYARGRGGQFLLRIEDTDLERSEDRFTRDILASMQWLGLGWDEEPVYQSKRLDVYLGKATELVEAGKAYRCYCTEADVEKMREVAMAAGKRPQYDRTCRARAAKDPAWFTTEKTAGDPYVIRLSVPLDGHVEFEDLIRGKIRVENTEVDDFVLIRSNGAPTYNLSVVVDDVYSKMTHILRGDDHINNTPKQIHLYNYFGYPQPKFAHLPMILGEDKKKLSKRHGAVSANAYREQGYLPEAMLNFLARLGWSHGDQEVFTVEEMVKLFDFDSVQKSGAVFNMEKLLWLNGAHIRAAQPERLRDLALADFGAGFEGEARARAQSPLGIELVKMLQPKVKLLTELSEQLLPLCVPGTVQVDPSGLKWNKDPALKAPIQAAIREAIALWDAKAGESGAPLRDRGVGHADVDQALRSLGEKHGVKLGDLTGPARLCVTGKAVSGAGLFDLIPILPWKDVRARLAQAASL